MKHYPLVRSTGIEPACPGDTRSLVLRVCQFRHDRISVFFDSFILLFLRSICKCFFMFFEKMFYGCALSGSNPLDCMHNKTDAQWTSALLWCGQRDSNPHGLPHGPEPCASANSAMTAYHIEQSYYTILRSKMQRKF